jgi:hypothetical protein
MLLRVPMLVVVAAYLVAIGCTMLSTRSATGAGSDIGIGSGSGSGEARTSAADQHHDLGSKHYERLSIHRP